MNPATILIAALVAVLFIAVIVRQIRRHRQGKSSCSCGCGGCAMSGNCQSKGPKNG